MRLGRCARIPGQVASSGLSQQRGWALPGGRDRGPAPLGSLQPVGPFKSPRPTCFSRTSTSGLHSCYPLRCGRRPQPPVWGFCSNLALSFTLRERRGGSFPRSQGEEAVCSCGCSAPGARGRQAGSRQPLPQGAPSPRCQPQSFADSDRHEGR